jgi:hypothetical protein
MHVDPSCMGAGFKAATLQAHLETRTLRNMTKNRTMSRAAASIAKGLFFGLLSAGLSLQQAIAADILALAPHPHKHAIFESEQASIATRNLADWVVDSGNNTRLPFAIVDKTDARVFVFDAEGRLRGEAPALVGLATGDDSIPGIGDRPLSGIRPEERTTPAGRFLASMDRDLGGTEVLWVDYKNAISMHPVINTNRAERRPERLASATPLDNRISYGCINVPPQFFKNIVRPTFTGTYGIVYVLPEVKSPREVFGSYEVAD